MLMQKIRGPVAVGGVGGSGTRVVATLLRELDFYLGGDLNSANDNLWFTLLLARPRWFARCSREDILTGLGIFEKAMKGTLHPVLDELRFAVRAALDLSLCEYLHWGPGAVRDAVRTIWPAKAALELAWAMQRIATMNLSSAMNGEASGWGWKEPCSYIYLKYLTEHFRDLKYIHVVRHGLDMAFSQNQGHVYGWGSVFGVQIPESRELLPKASLRYWIRANRASIRMGEDLLGDAFLVLSFDELCRDPRNKTRELADFLGLDEASVDLTRLHKLIRKPSSLGRYKDHGLGMFSKEEVLAVKDLGFAVHE